MFYKANRLDVIEPSPTLALTAKANALKAQGVDVISFGAGEPDFDTPEHIKNAAKRAMDKGLTKYTAVSGTPSLKEAIIAKFQKDNNLKYEKNQVIAGVGGKQVIYNFFMAVINPGDEVIVPAPYWVSYVDIVRLAGGVPVVVNTKRENDFKITPEELKANITPKTRVFIMNSPSNPTGSSYMRTEIEKLSEILVKNKILIFSDDIYEKIIYDNNQFCNPAMISNEVKEYTFIANGVSKAYSMTGWRIGFGAGNAEIIKNMDTMQSQSTSNPTSIAQAAAEEALNGDQKCVADMVVAFDKRRKLIVATLNAIKGFQCGMPTGAFYAFPYISEVYQMDGFQKLMKDSGEKSKSKVFCDHLLQKYNVAVVPGIAFGDDNAIRFSYAMSEKDITEGMKRVAEMVSSLK